MTPDYWTITVLDVDPELRAILAIEVALQDLDHEQRVRVMRFVEDRAFPVVQVSTDPMTVECAECEAKAGESCIDLETNRPQTGYHDSRHFVANGRVPR